MYKISKEYLDKISSGTVMPVAKLIIDNKEYRDFFKLNYYSRIIAENSNLSFGNVCSSYIEVELTPDEVSTLILSGHTAELYVGMHLEDFLNDEPERIEWLKLGLFNIEDTVVDPSKADSYSFTSYDNMTRLSKVPYMTSYNGTQKISTLLKEMCLPRGFNYAGGDSGETVDLDKHKEYLQTLDCLNVLSLLACKCGKNATINNQGNLELKLFEEVGMIIDGSEYSEITLGDTYFKVAQLECYEDDNRETLPIVYPTSNLETGRIVAFINPLVTQSDLKAIYERARAALTEPYMKLSLRTIIGKTELQVGDIIQVEDMNGKLHKLPIFSLSFEYDGGFPTTIGCEVLSEDTESSLNDSGTVQQTIQKQNGEIAKFTKITTDKLVALQIEVDTLSANDVTINGELTAVKASIKDLDVSKLQADIAHIKEAYLDKVTANELYAAKGSFTQLEADFAEIENLLAGNITSGSSHSIVLNSKNATIENALIKSAMIDSLSFDKLTGVDIDTSTINVHSSDGNSLWADNTIMFKDGLRPRVQIGKDAQGDYNIYIWDKQGKLMFDATGVTADGIKRPIIRDDMIQDNANISGTKININSLIKEVNGSTESIESNHIVYNGQKLDIVFNNLQSNVDTLGGNVISLTTQLNLQQGNIESLVSKSKQTDGEVNTLKTEYSSLKQTTDGIKATVNQHTSDIQKTNDDLQNTENAMTESYTSYVDVTSKNILLEVNEAINSNNADVDNKIASNKVNITNEYTELVKSSLQDVQSIVDGKVSQEQLSEYVRFNGATVEIGKSDSPFKNVITNDKMSFYQGTEEVAYISNNEMYILKARIIQELQVGQYVFKDEGELGFSLMMKEGVTYAV